MTIEYVARASRRFRVETRRTFGEEESEKKVWTTESFRFFMLPLPGDGRLSKRFSTVCEAMTAGLLNLYSLSFRTGLV